MPDPHEPKPWLMPERKRKAATSTRPIVELPPAKLPKPRKPKRPPKPLAEMRCDWCEAVFIQAKTWQRFCSTRCNNAMYAAGHPRVKDPNRALAEREKVRRLTGLQ